jgi:hypothetical protein
VPPASPTPVVEEPLLSVVPLPEVADVPDPELPV